MHGHGDDKWVRGRRWLDWILAGLFVMTTVFGIAGFAEGLSPHHKEDCVSTVIGWRETDPIYRFLLLFELGEGGLLVRECYNNGFLAIARFAGPLTVFAGILRLCWNYVAQRLDDWRLSWLREHMVIVGLGARGRAFMKNRVTRLPIVVVESKPNDDTRSFVERNHGLLIVGDGADPKVLRRARVGQAQAMLTATGDDEVNLQIAEAAMSLGERIPDLRVMISDPLIRRSLAGSTAGGRLDVLSLEELAARAFTDRVRLFELVELAGAPRLHLVLAGRGRLLAALVAQILRANVFPDHGRPALTLLAPDPEAVGRELELAFPGTADVAELIPIAFDPGAAAMHLGLAERIAEAGPVTAVISVGDSGQGALRPALALRDGLKRMNLWRAPIFFASASPDSLRPFTAHLDATPRLAEVFEPFAVSASLCNWRVIDALDATARGVHENYRRAHGAISEQGEAASQTVEALRPWEALPATYKRANRRAADHIAAKLLAAGCMTPPGPPRLPADLDLIEGEGELDRLAELEHEGWAVDRRLEGWTSGKVRHDPALIHDCLVPFNELRGPTQDLDREQIKALNDVLLTRAAAGAASDEPGLARRDLWVGITGPAEMSDANAKSWDGFVGAWVGDTLAPAARGRFITLVSSLAPGAALIGALRAADALDAARLPWRLVVPGTWSFPPSLAVANGLVARGGGNRVVPLDGAPQDAVRRQEAYLAIRCDVVLAAPGASAELLSWREQLGAVPRELSVRPRARRPLPPGLVATVAAKLA